MGRKREVQKGQWLEKHLHAQPGWQNKGKLSISPFQTRRFRTQGGVRKGSRRNHHQKLTWCAKDRRRYTGVHQQKFYIALGIKGLLPARMALKTRDFKYSSPVSPTGMKTPGTPFTQPLWAAKKYCTSVWKLNDGRHWAPTKGTHTLLFHAGPPSRAGIGPQDAILQLAVLKLNAITHTGLVEGPLTFSPGERSPALKLGHHLHKMHKFKSFWRHS